MGFYQSKGRMIGIANMVLALFIFQGCAQLETTENNYQAHGEISSEENNIKTVIKKSKPKIVATGLGACVQNRVKPGSQMASFMKAFNLVYDSKTKLVNREKYLQVSKKLSFASGFKVSNESPIKEVDFNNDKKIGATDKKIFNELGEYIKKCTPPTYANLAD